MSKYFNISSLASLYEKNKDYKNSIKTYEKLLDFAQNNKSLQKEYEIGVILAYDNLANAYFKNKDYNKTIKITKEALKEPNIPNKVKIDLLYTLAYAYEDTNLYQDALKIYKEIFKKVYKIYGKESIALSYAYYHIAQTLQKLHKYNEAITNYKEAAKLNIYKNGEDDKLTKDIYKQISILYYKLGNKQKAYKYLKKSLFK
jgi:tetratricopeptide (TPR) repeat protein